ncbi:hypothetical protein PENANT_c011G06791 [Penicillium antarcticum]|uniref:C3H1-type domain-containing protein n=1 Tax=Penicillium antarcticum TaxID=416450 RepID=A0A1V6Q720_9EURO|nr:hypothetical protein PENANT_c011G06791 [Penicillium antarcticum]
MGMDNNSMCRTGDEEVIEAAEEDKDMGTEAVEGITRKEDDRHILIRATAIHPTTPIQHHPFLHQHTCLPRHILGNRKVFKIIKTSPHTPHNFRRHQVPTSNYLTTRRTCLSPILRLQPIMGWGAEVPGHAAYMPAQPHARGPRPPHAHNGHNGHNGHSGPKLKQNHKRDHSSAFSKHTAPRTPAAPAVPSFGNPLPSKPPPAADANGNNRKQKKRKRKHNQLGLTPKTEDHESSEDDEEADEESKLATGESDAAPLQFSYRGQTATLQTPSEIAAWIAERKKKFPTKARVEEKQKVADEAKATREAARQLKCNEQQAKRNADRKPSDSNTESPNRADNQRRADKIQRNLDREQKRIAKAIAEAEAARLRFEALQKEALSLSSAAQEGSDIKTEPHDLPPISNEPPNEPRISESPLEAHPTVDADVSDPIIEIENPLDGDGDGADDMDISGSDWTSSSGSEADSNSESDSDSAPEQVSSRRTGPEKVAPPPREGKKTTCRYFARTGQCNRGDQCKFLHETTERGPKPKAEKKDKGRKGLYQALLDRQKQDEDHRAMEVISWLGQNNMLAPPDTQPH